MKYKKVAIYSYKKSYDKISIRKYRRHIDVEIRYEKVNRNNKKNINNRVIMEMDAYRLGEISAFVVDYNHTRTSTLKVNWLDKYFPFSSM